MKPLGKPLDPHAPRLPGVGLSVEVVQIILLDKRGTYLLYTDGKDMLLGDFFKDDFDKLAETFKSVSMLVVCGNRRIVGRADFGEDGWFVWDYREHEEAIRL